METKKFKMIALDYNCAPYPHPAAYLAGAKTRVESILGANDSTLLFEGKNGTFRFCAEIEEYTKAARKSLKLLEDKAFVEKVDSGSRASSAALQHTGQAIRDRDFSTASPSELVAAYAELFEGFVELNKWGHTVNMPDFATELFTQKVTQMLESKIAEAGASVSAAEAFGILATPSEKSLLAQEEQDFYEIVALARESAESNGVSPTAQKLLSVPYVSFALEDHARKYDWMQYHYSGPTILDKKHFAELLASELKQGTNPEEKLRAIWKKTKATEEKQATLEKELRLGEKEMHWLLIARKFMYLKALRKETVFFASRCAAPLFAEIAKRLGITPWEAQHLSPEQTAEALAGKGVDRKQLAATAELVVIYHDEGGVRMFTGDEAKKYSSAIYEESGEGIDELKGTPACLGTARGIVKIIARAEDMAKMNKGDILFSPATNPNLVPAMKKAAAIVTDEGGITCHAAIVSREMGVPCIVGTKVATKAFKDGDVVEVDAIKGIVRRVSN